MTEIISLHIGQAGVQLGSPCWKLFCNEHGILSDGTISNSDVEIKDNSFNPFFFESNFENKYLPRSLFFDFDPIGVDELRTGDLRHLFDPELIISGKDESANIYGRGYYTLGKKYIDLALEKIRKLANNCSNLQGFIIYSSAAGGTGSGFGALLSERLNIDYPKKAKMALNIYPSVMVSNSLIEPYNSIFSTNSHLEHTNLSILLDNEAIYDICRRQLNIEIPSYNNLNEIISHVSNNIIAPIRFKASLNADLTEMQTNLVPYPRFNYLLSSYSPIICSQTSYSKQFCVGEITNSLFNRDHNMANCDPLNGKYMASTLIYRGDVLPKDISCAISNIKVCRKINFIYWLSTGFKCGIIQQKPIFITEGSLAKLSRLGVMISNNTSIRDVFSRMKRKFNLMFNKKAFLHWYLAEGMEEGQFQEALENQSALEKDYEEVCQEINDEIDENDMI